LGDALGFGAGRSRSDGTGGGAGGGAGRVASERAGSALRRVLGEERGSVAAEFAVVLPAAAIVLVMGLGLVQLGTVQVRLTDAAADAARLIGRGESADARVAAAHPGATMTVSRTGAVVCVTLSARVAVGSGPDFPFEGTGCALDDTRAAPP
jgi:Flp pilus assembly protein TadG